MQVDGPGMRVIGDSIQFKEVNPTLLKNNPILTDPLFQGVDLSAKQIHKESKPIGLAINIISKTAQNDVDSCIQKLQNYGCLNSTQKASNSDDMFQEWIKVIMALKKADDFAPMSQLIAIYCEVIDPNDRYGSMYLAEWAMHAALYTFDYSVVASTLHKFNYQQLDTPKLKNVFFQCLDGAFKNRQYDQVKSLIMAMPEEKIQEFQHYLVKAETFSALKSLDENQHIYLGNPGKFMEDLKQTSLQVDMNHPDMKKHICRKILQVVNYGIKNQKPDRLEEVVNFSIDNYGSDSNVELLKMLLTYALNSSNQELFNNTINLLIQNPLKENFVGEVFHKHIKSALAQHFYSEITELIQSLEPNISELPENDLNARFLNEVKAEVDIMTMLNQSSIIEPEDITQVGQLISELANSNQFLSIEAKGRIMNSLDPLLASGLKMLFDAGDYSQLSTFIESILENYYEVGDKPYVYEYLLIALNFTDQTSRYFDHFTDWTMLMPAHIELQKKTISSYVLQSIQMGESLVKSRERLDTEDNMMIWLLLDENDKYLLDDARTIVYNHKKEPQVEQILQYNLNSVNSLVDMVGLCSTINSQLQGIILNENSPSLAKLNNHLALLIQNEQLVGESIHSKLIDLVSLPCLSSSLVLVDALLNSYATNFDIEGAIQFVSNGLNQLDAYPKVYNRLLLEVPKVAKNGSLQQVQAVYEGLISAEKRGENEYSKIAIDTAIKDIEMALKWKSGGVIIEGYVNNPQTLLNDICAYKNNPASYSLDDMKAATDFLFYNLVDIDKSSALLLLDAAMDNLYATPPVSMRINAMRLSFEIGQIQKAIWIATLIMAENSNNISAVESVIDLISHAIHLNIHLGDQVDLSRIQGHLESVIRGNFGFQRQITNIEAHKRNQVILENIQARKALLDYMSKGSDFTDYITSINEQFQSLNPLAKEDFQKEVFSHFKCIAAHMKENRAYGQLLDFAKEVKHLISKIDPIFYNQIRLDCGMKMNSPREVRHSFSYLKKHSKIDSAFLDNTNKTFEYFLGQGDIDMLESIISSFIQSLSQQLGHFEVSQSDVDGLVNKLNFELENIKGAFNQFEKDRFDDMHPTGLTNAQYSSVKGLMSFIRNPDDDLACAYYKNFMRYLNFSEALRTDINAAFQRIQSRDVQVSQDDFQVFDTLRRYCYKQSPGQSRAMHEAYDKLQKGINAQKIREKEAALNHINQKWSECQNNPHEVIRIFYPHLDSTLLSSSELSNYLSEIEDNLESEFAKISDSISFMKLAGVQHNVEKISLDDLKNVNSISSMGSFIESLQNANILPDPNTIDWINETKELINEFIDMSASERNLGDFAFRNLQRFKYVTGKSPRGDFLEKVEFLATMHGHAAIFDDSMGYEGYAHMYGSMVRTPESLENFLCDDLYSLDVNELINSKYQQYIQLLNDALIHEGLLNPATTPGMFIQEAYQGVLEELLNGTTAFNPIVETAEDRLEFIMMKQRIGYKLSSDESKDFEELLKDLSSREYTSLEERVTRDLHNIDSTSIFDQTWLNSKKANRKVYQHNKKVFGNLYNTPELQSASFGVSGAGSKISNYVKNIFQKTSVSDDFSLVDFDGGLICSAFQAKVTLKALSILNNKLNDKMAQLFPDFRSEYGKVAFIDMPTNIEEDWSRLTPMRSLEIFSKALKPSGYSDAFFEMVDADPKSFKVYAPNERSWTQKGVARFW